jgi:hypothetical protein
MPSSDFHLPIVVSPNAALLADFNEAFVIAAGA